MTLIKTSLLNSISVVIKMLTLLGINKALAVYVGPAGYAAVGQFQNAVQIFTTIASGAINNGVVKYTAEYHGNEEKQRELWRTAGAIALIGSIFTAAMIFILNRQLAVWFLNNENYGSVFIWFAAALSFFTFNTLFLAILNGKREILSFVAANISGSCFALIITVVLTRQLGLYGALVALGIYQSVTFLTTLVICRKKPWFQIRNVLGGINKKIAIDLAKYTAMALTAAICAPVTSMLIRNHLGELFGWEMAGYWEAMLRLSSSYLLMFSTVLGVYFLPKLSELQNPYEIRRELSRGYALIVPAVALAGCLVFFLKDYLIALLFSEKFYPMRGLFLWQMVGDAIKISAWLLSYLMLGKAMYRPYIIVEVLFSFSYYFLVVWFVNMLGFYAVSSAYALNYLAYLLVLIVVVKSYLKVQDDACKN